MTRRRKQLTTRDAITAALRSDVLAQVHKAYAKQPRRVQWRGCDIAVNADEGEATDQGWEAILKYPSGYFERAGTRLDVLFNEHSQWEECPVFIIHQLKAGATHLYAGDKAILGCWNEPEARKLYLANLGDDLLIGAVTCMRPEELERHIKAGEGGALSAHVQRKIMLSRRQVAKAESELIERREWLQGRVKVLKQGGSDHAQRNDEAVFKAVESIGLAAQALGALELEVVADVEKAASGEAPRRLLRVTPTFEAIDLQNQLTTKDVIREAWPYYEKAGNFDLEHLTKKGGKSFAEYRAKVLAQGFPMPEGIDEVAGRNYFEIGRPVPGSFDEEGCTYLVEIYQNHPPADWFWSTLTEVTPAWQWKCSIGGAAKLAEVVAENPEPIFGKGHQQKFEVLRQFRWNNTAATLEPINFYCPPVEIIREGEFEISKGLDVEFIEETPMNKAEMVNASDVLKMALLERTQDILMDMVDSGQLESSDHLAITQSVAKALEAIEAEAKVVKALDYGMVTTDVAEMEGGHAFTASALSQRQIKRCAKELKEDIQAGWTPFVKGYAWSEDPIVDIADYAMGEFGCGADEAIAIAQAVLGVDEAH